MNKYANIDCPVCSQPLSDGQDIVVCPECGAPYHLDCYKKEQKCIFSELHEKGEEWKAPHKEEKFDGKIEFRCSRCGTVNPPEGIFCQVCGSQLNHANQENGQPVSQPFPPNMGTNGTPNNQFSPFEMPLNPFVSPFGNVSPDEDIDGIPAKEMAIFVGRNTHYFLPRFKQLAQSKGKAKILNWSAFLFTGGYFLYRKMYLQGILLLLLNLVLSIPSTLSTLATMGTTMSGMSFLSESQSLAIMMAINIITLGIRFFCGFMANTLYKKHVEKKIIQIKENTQGNEELFLTTLRKKGSVATTLIYGLLIGTFLLYFIMTCFTLFVGY